QPHAQLCFPSRLYQFLCGVQIFILAGVLYYYFQGSVGNTAPDHGIVGESSQPIGDTLRPVWGRMDKCYPVTAQRRRVKRGKKQGFEATTPAAAGGLNDAAPKEETGILAQAEGEEATSPIPAGKVVAEEVAVAGTSGWEENKKVPKETAAYTSEASEVDVKEERPGGWVPQLLRTLWPGWFPASEIPKTQDHE
uniref:Uncharacterized protein n=1 Tax=Sus scrofa TaxID=9823 RepID=A0A8D2BQ40_PIG